MTKTEYRRRRQVFIFSTTQADTGVFITMCALCRMCLYSHQLKHFCIRKLQIYIIQLIRSYTCFPLPLTN